ncbi:Uu.00g022140.m01.CDS01 [Anthostomella pinea]|uniref:Uu.00g022140.m01.CDS01 n=1 Tax=Anthostomella pinea TaxID=933095 RepID=A0AAI8W0B5_9PEZI|nr:Uu.00g022140.m01.CDS01 [Anthostomella pinea]
MAELSEEAPATAGKDVVDAPVTLVEPVLEEEKKKKKKKKKKGKKTPKSRKNITGFEEFYADAPMTPAEAALEKKQLYDPTRPFADRIEECIQRYRARRRLDEERTQMFNKYLFLGGIDSSPRQFTGMGLDKEGLEEADADQIRSMTAVDFVGNAGSRFYDGTVTEHWEVDFEAIVKGFLSRFIPDLYMHDPKANQTAADLIKNFLNYVLMHDACPEYTENIMAARQVCEIAPTELMYMHELTVELPGPFNIAARILFCDGLVSEMDKPEALGAWFNFRLTVLVWNTINAEAKTKVMQCEDPKSIHVVDTKEQTYMVVDTERPRRKDKKMVEEQLEESGQGGKILPAGFIRVIPTIIAHGYGNLPRPDEVDLDLSEGNEERFILEDVYLAKLENGMKIRMTVCELNVGLRFIKEVHDLRVTFDTFLPQYLMANWKDPVPNERPPPSVNDPDVNERAMQALSLDD